jgi:hypothetical protein
MRLLASTLALALTVAGASSAATTRVSDAQYLQLARCAGLVEGSGADASAIEATLRDNRSRREDYIRARARSNRTDAAADFRRASGAERERLEAEKAACAA